MTFLDPSTSYITLTPKILIIQRLCDSAIVSREQGVKDKDYSHKVYVVRYTTDHSRVTVGKIFPVWTRRLIHELLVITQLHFLYCTKINVIKVE